MHCKMMIGVAVAALSARLDGTAGPARSGAHAGADALQLDRAHNELVLPARLIDRHVPLQQNLLPVCQQMAMRNLFAAEQNAAQLRSHILEREINVAGALRAQICDLARDPDRTNLFLKQPPDLRRQFADRQHAPGLLGRKQLAEVPLGFGLFAHQNFNSIKPRIEHG